MPTIPKMNQPRNISSRVENINQSTAGVGASARAVAQIAGGVENFSNMLLQKRAEAEAKDYYHQSALEKQGDRQTLTTQLSRSMNSMTGVIEFGDNEDLRARFGQYEGKKYADAIGEWEEERDKFYLDNAPTMLAKEIYNDRQKRETRASTLKADSDQHTVMANTRKTRDYEDAVFRAKELETHDSKEKGVKAVDSAEDQLKGLKEYYADQIGVYYGDEESRKAWKGNGRLLGIASIDSAFNNEEYQSIADTLGLTQFQNPEIAKLLKDQAKSELGLEVTEFKKLKDGSLVGIGKGDESVVLDFKDGVLTKVATKNLMDFEAITVEGQFEEKKPSLVKEVLKLEDVAKSTGKLFKVMKGRHTEINNQLKREHQNLIFSITNPDKASRLDLNSEEGKAVITEHLIATNKSTLPEDEKEKMTIDTIVSVAVSDAMDNHVLMNPEQADKEHKRVLPENLLLEDFSRFLNLEKDLLSPNLRDRLEDVRKSGRIVGTARNKLAQSYSTYRDMMEKHGGDYVDYHDPKVKILSKYRDSSLQGYTKWRDSLFDRQDKLKIPRELPDSYLDNIASKLNQEIEETFDSKVVASRTLSNLKRNWGSDFYKNIKQLQKRGIKDEYLYATLLLNEGKGGADNILDSAKIIQNAKNWGGKEGTENHYRETKELQQRANLIKQLVVNEVAPFIRGNENGQLFGERNATSKVMLDVAYQEALSVDRATGKSKDISQLSKDAVNKMLRKHWSVVEGEKSTVLIPNQVLRENNLNTDMVKKAGDKFNDKKFIKENIDLTEIEDMLEDRYNLPIKQLPKNRREEEIINFITNGTLGDLKFDSTDNGIAPFIQSRDGVPKYLRNKDKVPYELDYKDIPTFIQGE